MFSYALFIKDIYPPIYRQKIESKILHMQTRVSWKDCKKNTKYVKNGEQN